MPLKKHPISHFTQLLSAHRAFTGKNFLKISGFYLKLLAREPFRLLEQWKFGRRAIERVKLEKDPLFILGHWRSGTSFLQYLVGRDPRLGYLNKFQSLFPDLFLGSERILKPIVRQISSLIPVTNAMDRISIDLDWDSPGELDVALTTLVSTVSPHWGHMFARDGREYFDKYLFFDTISNREEKHWKQLHLYMIKKLTLRYEGKRILIKSPGNTARIKKLLDIYPNARFIYIHRNPYDVFYSNRKLWDILLKNIGLQELEQQEIDDLIMDLYQRVIQKYLEQRELVPNHNLVELKFEEVTEQPVSQLRYTYEMLNMPGFDEAETHFEEFAASQAQKKPSRYDYEPDIIKRINENWDFSLEAWPYPDPMTEEKMMVAV